jgi:hypothetical protein
MAGKALCFLVRCSELDAGTFRIRVAITDKDGNPIKRRVYLFNRGSRRIIQEKWTDAAGSAVFNYLAYLYRGYTVSVSNNITDAGAPEYPAIADFVTPEAMP